MDKIITLFLAGGDSTRFWPVGEKHSIKFFGKPLIYHTLSQYFRYGLHDFIIVTNPGNHEMFERVKTEYTNCNITLISQENRHGMAGAIQSASSAISRRPLLIANPSDCVEDVLLSEFDRILSPGLQSAIAGIEMDSYFPGGYLQISDGSVKGIIEKPKPENVPSKYVALVFDYFADSNALIQAISDVHDSVDDAFEQAVQKRIDSGMQCSFLPYKGYWGTLKYPWHVLPLMSYYLTTRTGKRTILSNDIDKTAVITGDVIIEEGVRILEYSKVIGPCYIGKGTIIGNHAVVRDSIIGAQCVIGHTCEITRSYIGDNCWFHRNYVGDSIISDYVSMGSGATTANYRIDEKPVESAIGKKKISTSRTKLGAMIGKNAKIGVNTSIMPGRKIGKNTLIGAGIILDRDIPDDSFCMIKKSSFTIQKNRRTATKNENKENRQNLKFS